MNWFSCISNRNILAVSDVQMNRIHSNITQKLRAQVYGGFRHLLLLRFIIILYLNHILRFDMNSLLEKQCGSWPVCGSATLSLSLSSLHPLFDSHYTL